MIRLLPRVAFDLDDVVIDSYEEMVAGLRRKFGVHFPKREHKSYHFDVPGIPDEEVADCIQKTMAADTLHCEPIPGAIEMLRRVHELTIRPLQFVTARPEEARQITVDWLAANLPGVPFDLRMTDLKPKTDVLAELGVDVFVDDRYRTAHEVADVVVLSVLVNRPWNLRRPTTKPNVVRIEDVGEVFPLCFSAAARK
jgi:uncharacterized HAD superfamily protein